MPETGVMKEVVMNSGDSTMKCREMNPGNGHILTHTISRAAIENCERSNISHPFSRIIQDTNAEKDIENGALAPRNLTASAPRENTRRFSSR